MIKGEGTVVQEVATLEKELTTLIFRNPIYTFKSELDSLRHIKKCEEILKKVTFQIFDVKEWIVENDSLVCQAQTENGLPQIQPVVDSFENLMQRVQGLPPDSSFICYEQAIAYNLSHLLFHGQICHFIVDGFHKCASVLQSSLLRACECLKVKFPTREGNVLSPVNDDCFQELLSSLFQALTKNSIGCAPFVLSICLLALLQLLQGHANEGVELLSLTKCQLDCLKDGSVGITEEIASSLPVFLFHLEYNSSVPSCVVSFSVQDSRDIQNMVSMVTSLLAFFHSSCKKYDDALRMLCEKGDSEEISFNDLYLKGYILYMKNDIDEALTCFQQCLLISSANHRSAVLNMLGCCCARKGKHHTAVAKFREALEQNFQQLESLFNVSLQYRKLGNYTAEMRSLELLKQALKCKRQGHEGFHDVTVTSIASGNNNDFKNEILDMELSFPSRFGVACGISSSGITREFITFVLAKRCVELGRFEDGAKNYLDLVAILVEMPVSSHVNPWKLPSPSELYRQCAFALLKAARYEDTVTVCDKMLTSSSYSITSTAEDSDRATSSKSVTREHGNYPRKRLRSTEEERRGEDTGSLSENVAMLMYKADALVHLKQPLEALQSLNRILKALKGIYSSTFQSGQQSDDIQQEQSRKKRKLACGNISASLEQNQGCQLNKLVKIKVQAYNKKASILESLGQIHVALQQLHLALECLPDNSETVYKHTQLLFKLGCCKDAAFNWLRFRQVDTNTHKEDLQSIRDSLRSSAANFSEVDLSAAQVEATDELALKWRSKNDDFLLKFVEDVDARNVKCSSHE